jgi:hypothetical protein
VVLLTGPDIAAIWVQLTRGNALLTAGCAVKAVEHRSLKKKAATGDHLTSVTTSAGVSGLVRNEWSYVIFKAEG